MTVSRASLLARFPGAFDALNEGAVTAAVAVAVARVSRPAFRDDTLADEATHQLAAHMVSQLKSSSAGAGAISGATVGGVSVTFAGASADDSLKGTSYGRAYLELVNAKVIGFRVAGGVC